MKHINQTLKEQFKVISTQFNKENEYLGISEAQLVQNQIDRLSREYGQLKIKQKNKYEQAMDFVNDEFSFWKNFTCKKLLTTVQKSKIINQ